MVSKAVIIALFVTGILIASAVVICLARLASIADESQVDWLRKEGYLDADEEESESE